MNATVTIEAETEPVIDPQLVADQDYIDAGIRIAKRSKSSIDSITAK